MFFLLRMAFWVSVILVLVPSFVSKDTSHTPAESLKLDASDAVSAASATVADLRHFCSRQPDACAIGAQAASAFGQKAQAGVRILYEYMQDQIGPKETGSVGGAASRSAKPAADKSTAEKSAGDKTIAIMRSRDTLSPADLAPPAWTVPIPRPAPPTRGAA